MSRPLSATSIPIAVMMLGLALAACGEAGRDGAGQAGAREAAADSPATRVATKDAGSALAARKPGRGPLRHDTGSGEHLSDRSLESKSGPVRSRVCEVDFNDPRASALTAQSVRQDEIHQPWWQHCPGAGYVDVRATVWGFLHMPFRDFDVGDCRSAELDDGTPRRRDARGACEPVQPANEMRAHAVTNGPEETVRIRAYADRSDEYVESAFDLTRIRILGSNPARLCFKARQGPAEPAPADAAPADSGAFWACFDDLAPGTWDLSDWVVDVSEVTLANVDGNPFSFDGLGIAIRPR